MKHCENFIKKSVNMKDMMFVLDDIDDFYFSKKERNGNHFQFYCKRLRLRRKIMT